MSRLSYGGDMFSPVRGTSLMNDDASKIGSDSDFSDLWKGSGDSFGSIGNSQIMKNTLLCSDDYKDPFDVTTISEKDEVFTNASVKDVTLKTDLPKIAYDYVSTRSENSVHQKEFEKLQKDFKEMQKSKMKQNNKPSNTVRKDSKPKPDVQKSRVVSYSKVGQSNNNSFSPTLSGLAEENSEKNIASDAKANSLKTGKNNTSSSQTKTKTSRSALNNTEVLTQSNLKSNKLEKRSKVTHRQVARKEELPVASKSELKVSDENSENVGETKKCEEAASNTTNTNHMQVQANIIEKLVKEAVSFEFDGIRQMLYLQHLSLIKHMDKNAVDCDSLLNIIGHLVEENKQLKSTIFAYQNM